MTDTSPINLISGDCLEVMAELEADSFDALVTDPPYHLISIVKRFGSGAAKAASFGTDGNYARSSKGFMGQNWDGGDIAFRPETWEQALRLLKPGAHLVAFNHSRTYHHMTTAIEAAGFEIRDGLLFLYDTDPAWSEFLDGLHPDQVKAFARAMGGTSAILAWLYGCGFPKSHPVAKGIKKLLGEDAQEAEAWDGWGTTLKPAFEPIVLARKPLSEASIPKQHLATGTGALNIDATRTPAEDPEALAEKYRSIQGTGARQNSIYGKDTRSRAGSGPHDEGRWPANVLLDGSTRVGSLFPAEVKNGLVTNSTSRFFYSAKASAADRRGSDHPTVKPHELMRWLVRLVCPPGGRILDPFAGSGSTGWAAAAEGFECVLIERETKYQADIRRGIADLQINSTPIDTPAEDALPGQASLFSNLTERTEP